MPLMFDLPAALLTVFLTDWLDMVSLVRLDSANCNGESRSTYLDILSSPVSCFPQAPSPQTIRSRGIQWFAARHASVTKILIEQRFRYPESDKMIMSFFRRNGSHLQHLHIKGYEQALSMMLNDLGSSSPPRLMSLHMERCGVVDSTELGFLLSMCSRTLKSLSLTGCIITSALPVNILPNLEWLHISDSLIGLDVVRGLITACLNLRSYSCSNLSEKDGIFDALASHCPLLRNLSYGRGRLSVASLVRLLRSCTKIEVVNLFCDEEPDVGTRDQHIAAVIEHCTNLKAFCAGNKGRPARFSRSTLQAVAARAKDLRHLCLHGLDDDADTESGIRAIAQNCGTLKSLELDTYESSIPCGALTSLVSNLHSIEELCIYSSLDDNVLTAIAANCPLLRVLNLCGCDGYTMQGLAAVAYNCTALQLVSYQGVDGVLNPASETMWRGLRPGIKFHDRGAHCSLWETVRDAESKERVVW